MKLLLNPLPIRRARIHPARWRPPDSAHGQQQSGAGRPTVASLQHALQFGRHVVRTVAGRPGLGRSDFGASVAADRRATWSPTAITVAAAPDADSAGTSTGDGESIRQFNN